MLAEQQTTRRPSVSISRDCRIAALAGIASTGAAEDGRSARCTSKTELVDRTLTVRIENGDTLPSASQSIRADGTVPVGKLSRKSRSKVRTGCYTCK